MNKRIVNDAVSACIRLMSVVKRTNVLSLTHPIRNTKKGTHVFTSFMRVSIRWSSVSIIITAHKDKNNRAVNSLFISVHSLHALTRKDRACIHFVGLLVSLSSIPG